MLAFENWAGKSVECSKISGHIRRDWKSAESNADDEGLGCEDSEGSLKVP